MCWIVKWYGKYGRKVSWIVKRYEKYGRKVSWNVKWYGKYGRKASRIVKRYETYGWKVGIIEMILKIWNKSKLNSDEIWKIWKNKSVE